MKTRFLWPLLLCVLMSIATQASSLSSKKLKKKVKEPSTFLTLSYQNSGARINHTETSTSTGFTSLGKELDVGFNNFSIKGSREFFSSGAFSFNAMARFGFNRNTGNNTTAETNIDYENKVQGLLYGAGLGINYNIYAYDLKIQPFFSSQYVISKNTFDLSYIVSTGTPFEISYDESSNFLEHSIGVRFIDNEKKLMSFVSFDIIQEVSRLSDVSAIQSGQVIALTQTPGVIRNSTGFTIGIGFLF